MKHYFLSLISLLIIALLAGCDSKNTGEATSESDTTDAKATVDQTTGQVAENEDTDMRDLVYFTFMNTQMQTILGNMAEQKASSSAVKSFGGDLAETNKQMAAQIEDLARAAKMRLPEGLQVEQQQKIDSIQKLPPQEFDKAFVTLVLEQQSENIELLEGLAASSDNAIIRGLAADIADAQQTQIERAEIVNEKMM